MAKPVVDRIEEDLEGQAQVVRIGIMSEVGRTLAGRYGVRGVPAMLVFDTQGELVYSAVGMPDQEAIAGVVEQTLSP